MSEGYKRRGNLSSNILKRTKISLFVIKRSKNEFNLVTFI